MDTFEASLTSFDNSSDQHNFMEFFQQQQQQQQQQHPFHQSGLSPMGANGSAQDHTSHNHNNDNTINAAPTMMPNPSSSPTATLLRSSASPTSYEHTAGDTTAATTASSDSPSSSFAHHGSTSATPISASKMANGAKGFAASHQIYPVTATPNRHSSLPFDQSLISQQQQQQQQQPRLLAGSSSRGFSTGSPSSNSGSSNFMRPPPIQTTPMSNGSTSNQADFLNPHSGLSTSPSPLRTSSPLNAMQSPHGINRQSTTDSINDSNDQTLMYRSPSPYSPSYNNGSGGNAKDAGGTPTDGSSAASAKFVHKLFRMVSDAEYQHLISWNASGTSVVVTNFDDFAKEVLGKHFKHSNFSSFIRQLNMYGFYKVNKTPRGHRHSVETQVWEFSHPKFIRGHPELLDDIRRKALDSEHARVEARDLQYSVSVGHMQLRQQVDDQQYRIEELFEMNMALRQMVGGLRDTLTNVLEWVKVNNGGQLPFDNRLAIMEMPPTPMMHPYMQDAAWGGNTPGLPSEDMIVADGPPIFVTEPAFHSQQQQQQQQQHPSTMNQDVFSMSSMGQVSPIGSRRVSASSQSGEGSHKLTLDTSQLQYGNPGLGVMGLSSPNHNMMTAINTPLPASPAIHSGPQMGGGGYADSPFLGSPAMTSFPSSGGGGGGYFTAAASPMMSSNIDEEDSMLGPNSKSMRTQMKRTASNAGQHQMAMQAALQKHAQQQQQQQQLLQQKRKSPGV